MSPVAWQKGQAWLRNRLTTEAEVPWLTLQGALRQVGDLRADLAEDEVGRHAQLDEIERWLHQRSHYFQLAA